MKIFFKQWFVLLAALLLSCAVQAKGPVRADDAITVVALASLPPEVGQVLAQIKQGGPYAFAKDGIVFGNYEGVLPRQKRGYYHEFTVKTPKARNRGARRIVAGGNPQTSGEYYYTKDHYRTFQRIKE